ncbi:hypothetical protein B0H14DRAFT_3859847 [Mycena olivaceomarginata]|nr:hypothetical protein B0H14DRAFT_3859847 [Mycena olivaceomarginata]
MAASLSEDSLRFAVPCFALSHRAWSENKWSFCRPAGEVGAGQWRFRLRARQILLPVVPALENPPAALPTPLRPAATWRLSCQFAPRPAVVPVDDRARAARCAGGSPSHAKCCCRACERGGDTPDKAVFPLSYST